MFSWCNEFWNSFLLILSLLGFNNIVVYDFDIIEEYNIPNQFYRIEDIGKHKTVALKEIVKSFSDIDIEINNIEVTEKTIIEDELNIIYILTFDTLKNRKLIFDKIKHLNENYIVDSRCGGEEYHILSYNLSNKNEVNEWEKSFNIKETNLPCGEKSICYTNLSVAAEVCNIIKKINNGEQYPNKLIRHMKTYNIINNLKGGQK